MHSPKGTVKLSGRLLMIAGLLKPEECICDIGCDHGYLSVYMIQEGIAQRVIAADLKKGPLERAAENVGRYGLDSRVLLRLSDGAENIEPFEAGEAVIAGMGGMLMEGILSRRPEVFHNMSALVLSPQSDLAHFRTFLGESGYVIEDEGIACDGGKYYFAMRAVYAPYMPLQETGGSICFSGDGKTDRELSLRYGRPLLLKKEPLLAGYLADERKKLEIAVKRAGESRGERSRLQTVGLLREIELNGMAQRVLEGTG